MKEKKPFNILGIDMRSKSTHMEPGLLLLYFFLIYHVSSLLLGWYGILGEKYANIFYTLYDAKVIIYTSLLIAVSYGAFLLGRLVSFRYFRQKQFYPTRINKYYLASAIVALVAVMVLYLFAKLGGNFTHYVYGKAIGGVGYYQSIKSLCDFVLIAIFTIFLNQYLIFGDRNALVICVLSVLLELALAMSGARKPLFTFFVIYIIFYLRHNGVNFNIVLAIAVSLFLSVLMYAMRSGSDNLNWESILHETLFSHLRLANEVHFYLSGKEEVDYRYIFFPIIAMLPRIIFENKDELLVTDNSSWVSSQYADVGGSNVIGSLLVNSGPVSVVVYYFVVGVIGSKLYYRFKQGDSLFPMYVVFLLFYPLTYGYVFSVKIYIEFMVLIYILFSFRFKFGKLIM
ncbi:hypothetical protein GCM10027040_22180 [Halomonas shantousis]